MLWRIWRNNKKSSTYLEGFNCVTRKTDDRLSSPRFGEWKCVWPARQNCTFLVDNIYQVLFIIKANNYSKAPNLLHIKFAKKNPPATLFYIKIFQNTLCFKKMPEMKDTMNSSIEKLCYLSMLDLLQALST